MTVAASSVRTLIPFTGGNWKPVVENEVFAAIIKKPPSFWGLKAGQFEIFDITKCTFKNPESEDNTGRASGTKLKKKDLQKGWDVTQRPLIVVFHRGNYYLWDGFNRWIRLQELGETTAPVWLYHLMEGFDFQDVKDHVQLSANDHAQSDGASRQDFINTGVNWTKREGKKGNVIDTIEPIREWVNRSDHQFKDKDIDRIAAAILVESEVTNIRHIPTGSAAKSEAYKFLDLELEYGVGDELTNPIVLCTKEDDYITDAFMQHMKKFTQEGNDLEITQLIGYTKGCETEEDVIRQRQNAKDRFDQLDELVWNYCHAKMMKRGETYKWEGFLPQLFGKECGEGVPRNLA
tara:strand:- start:85 stop:1128 length:1044 start_codon:yes stop_codon:yes gene_type:complete